MIYQPGDLDRLLFAVDEAQTIDTRAVVKQSGVPWARAKSALVELEKRGKVTSDLGHHHGDGDLCQCEAGVTAGLPRLTHWHVA
jgi:hypothetical protein